ncbi:hypothetical protein CYLTODRAFT_411408 [Cylindrobasidium torrendii FP15055 ss-10]|uniref:Uncharacterized protein n=1 Tax=Cylindrobasidium torrendii FP15055 ss-10 TaxID=1314674 RepID=A0A0D7B906_9AGAR|nr:hypothetical protein CYLTODRAFT_411408 [Cylindrobasidium torrendii FP15055 ss-10]
MSCEAELAKQGISHLRTGSLQRWLNNSQASGTHSGCWVTQNPRTRSSVIGMKPERNGEVTYLRSTQAIVESSYAMLGYAFGLPWNQLGIKPFRNGIQDPSENEGAQQFNRFQLEMLGKRVYGKQSIALNKPSNALRTWIAGRRFCTYISCGDTEHDGCDQCLFTLRSGLFISTSMSGSRYRGVKSGEPVNARSYYSSKKITVSYCGPQNAGHLSPWGKPIESTESRINPSRAYDMWIALYMEYINLLLTLGKYDIYYTMVSGVRQCLFKCGDWGLLTDRSKSETTRKPGGHKVRILRTQRSLFSSFVSDRSRGGFIKASASENRNRFLEMLRIMYYYLVRPIGKAPLYWLSYPGIQNNGASVSIYVLRYILSLVADKFTLV